MADSKLAGAELVGQLPALPASRRSGAGRKRGGSSSGTSGAGAIFRACDGRACKLCGERDDSWDPLAKATGVAHDVTVVEACRAWGYPVTACGTTVGSCCWYCTRVWGGRYRSKGHTLTTLISYLGADDEEFKQFLALVKQVSDFVIEKSSRKVAFPWDAFDRKVLEFSQEHESRFEAPDDAYWELSYYRSQKGDPATNGLNHKVVQKDGKDFVVVPGSSGLVSTSLP